MANKKEIKKAEIQEYAKSLFLEVNETGKRVYSYRQIEEEIKQKFSKSVANTTIRNWGKNNNWELLLQTAKNLGVEKALKEKEDAEQLIKDAKSDEIADIYKKEDEKYQLATDIVVDILKSIKQKISEVEGNKEMDAFAFANTMRDIANVANQCFSNIQKLSGNKNDDSLDKLKEMFDNV